MSPGLIVLAAVSLAIGLLLAFRGHRLFPSLLTQWEAGVAGALFVCAAVVMGLLGTFGG
jgi:hypothetical protein